MPNLLRSPDTLSARELYDALYNARRAVGECREILQSLYRRNAGASPSAAALTGAIVHARHELSEAQAVEQALAAEHHRRTIGAALDGSPSRLPIAVPADPVPVEVAEGVPPEAPPVRKRRVRRKKEEEPVPEPNPRVTLPRLWRRYFNQIGVEIEGGWPSSVHTLIEERMEAIADGQRQQRYRGETVTPPQVVPIQLVGDGSVNVSARVSGELNIGPFADLEAVKGTLTQAWPTTVNATCGLHVHLSLKRDHYYLRLLQPEVTTRLTNRLGEWGRKKGLPGGHPLWPRLGGENTYCKPDYFGEEQIQATSKASNRYTMINYCKRLHGTLEVRVLPMFTDAETGWEAIAQIIQILGEYLYENRGQERRDRFTETASIQEEDQVTHEEVRVGLWAFAL